MWKQITPEDGNIGGSEDQPHFVYGWNGDQYPRLVVCILPYRILREPCIACNHKMDVNDWWHVDYLPLDVVPDLPTLLKEPMPLSK